MIDARTTSARDARVMTRARRALKRSLDLSGAVVGLLVLVLPLAVLAALVKLSSAGPAFFVQTRVGRHGRLFRCVKFRTMRVGAEAGGSVTVAGDARVTPIGRFLRRSKLDECPQLWNVLLGQMSLVGPRPDVPGYADRLEGDARRLLELRPGITGPATLHFRDEEALLASVSDARQYNDTVIWPTKVALNLDYLDTWTLWADIRCLYETVRPRRTS